MLKEVKKRNDADFLPVAPFRWGCVYNWQSTTIWFISALHGIDLIRISRETYASRGKDLEHSLTGR
jgi:hypothetical protein